MEIVENYIKGAWPSILRAILNKHRIVKIEYKNEVFKCIELPEPLLTRIAYQDINRVPNDSLWQSEDALYKYSDNVIDGKNETGFEYSYGERLRYYFGKDQIQYVIDTLKKNKTSRQAICSLWMPEKDMESEHPPCLNICDYIIRDAEFYSTYYIRSNDMYGAFPENAFLFTELNEYICNEIDRNMMLGSLSIISNKAHIYEHDIRKAGEIVKMPKYYIDSIMEKIEEV